MPSKRKASKTGRIEPGAASRPRILVVDDEEDFLRITAMRLEAAGYDVATASDHAAAFRSIREKVPDLILLDLMMPGVDGFQMKEKLGSEASTAGVPVIFLTAKDLVADKVKAFKLGIDGYITKPYAPRGLVARMESVLGRKRIYEEISMTDGVTGLHNISYYRKQVKTFFAIAKRYGQVFSLAVVDVDRLKAINDAHGQLAGDCALRHFASTARRVLREADIVTRYGGDEFAVIMPNVGAKAASRAMERLAQQIAKSPFSCEGVPGPISFTVSAGVAEYDAGMKAPEELFNLADARMYEAKRRGR
jgi:diguanylate cyclase (GGDEF)-like protein